MQSYPRRVRARRIFAQQGKRSSIGVEEKRSNETNVSTCIDGEVDHDANES
jgi:hypothetical protein